ncbi:MAG: hypothetical protein RIA69_18515 [Cyclobacteriaceae bacterium]
MIWALLNIAFFAVAQHFLSGYKKQFSLMNIYWNVVNLVLSLSGLFSHQEQLERLSLAQTIEAQYSLEKILLFNAGLDVGYIFLGLWLIQKSLTSSKSQERFKGYGQSIVIQGLWLFLFDLTFYAFLNEHGQSLTSLLDI